MKSSVYRGEPCRTVKKHDYTPKKVEPCRTGQRCRTRITLAESNLNFSAKMIRTGNYKDKVVQTYLYMLSHSRCESRVPLCYTGDLGPCSSHNLHKHRLRHRYIPVFSCFVFKPISDDIVYYQCV
jgi:hypothetical protein